ncbi:putative quinol monooxygenase [Sphingorhabdus sp. EL138]|jgi:quinol monooxygenase YgiN|uniref:putative quinol monooxygenase n=1 Tax=Sphingorhabdus sp. EL138 TaxID=2073156 RepID=UPI000D68CAC4|nr:antibiotic biosynthesis monooxygenase family protein [Sphingorhabdus sp. EL138]
MIQNQAFNLLKYLLIIFSIATLPACANAPATSDTEAPVTLIINFEASNEGLKEFSEIMAGVSEAMASEPGFVSAIVYRNVETPNVFVLQEVWASKELHGEHYDRIVASGDWGHIKSLLKVEPVMGYYTSDSTDQ